LYFQLPSLFQLPPVLAIEPIEPNSCPSAVRFDLVDKKFGSKFGSVPQEASLVQFSLQVQIIKCGAVRGQFDMFDVA
jgi:hypothetical protein